LAHTSNVDLICDKLPLNSSVTQEPDATMTTHKRTQVRQCT